MAARTHLVERARHLLEKLARARVDAERDARDLVAALAQLDEARDQRRGQVVDAVVAEVLEHVQRRRLAGPTAR